MRRKKIHNSTATFSQTRSRQVRETNCYILNKICVINLSFAEATEVFRHAYRYKNVRNEVMVIKKGEKLQNKIEV